MASTNTSPIDDKSVILWKDETLGVVKVNETPAGSGWSVIAWEVGTGIRKVNQGGGKDKDKDKHRRQWQRQRQTQKDNKTKRKQGNYLRCFGWGSTKVKWEGGFKDLELRIKNFYIVNQK